LKETNQFRRSESLNHLFKEKKEMFVNHMDAARLASARRHVASLALLLVLACAAATVRAQNNFSSGSTGADGAFNPTSNVTIVAPESGVFNYTTVNIPSGVTVTYVRNTTVNKPVVILAQGAVTITGAINLDGRNGNTNGFGGLGGPGGFGGGAGGYGFDQTFSGVPGEGPGGAGGGIGSAPIAAPGGGGGGGYGTAGGVGGGPSVGGQAGARFGTVTILPLIGGSGGGGGACYVNERGGAGGGGGGAILIASSVSITLGGSISSRGGSANSGSASGGGGSGGAVRLIANTITGSGNINVSGGGSAGSFRGYGGGGGGQGLIRIEAFDYTNFTGASTPTNIISFALPHPVAVTNGPSLRIASVGGVNSPTAPLGSLQGVPDIVVPTTQANPVAVAIEGANIPLGTVVQMTVTPSRGGRTTVSSTGLAGTEAASTATASVTLPAGISVISAAATIDLTTTASARPLIMDGERVDRIEVAATFGGASEVTYVTRSGRRIKRLTN
jgi:hypothetical protein